MGRADESEVGDAGPESGEWSFRADPRLEERTRQAYAAWMLWKDPTLAATGLRTLWKSQTPRERNAWRVAVATARSQLVTGLEPE